VVQNHVRAACGAGEDLGVANVTVVLLEAAQVREVAPRAGALVVEHHTIWSADYEDWSANDKARVEQLLHASPADAAEVEYLRQHTGFARLITVTPADLERVSVS
jgi:hypothetical protein